MTRVENLSHILAWSNVKDSVSAPSHLAKGCPQIDSVELPRLKLAFTSRTDHEGKNNLYSIDHADLYISNERPHILGC